MLLKKVKTHIIQDQPHHCRSSHIRLKSFVFIPFTIFKIIAIRINTHPTTIPQISIVVIFSIGLINFASIIFSFPNTLPYKNPNIEEAIPPKC